MATQNPSPEHERLVKALLRFLVERGYKADTKRVETTGGYIPDVIGRSPSGERVFGEAKTADDVLKKHTSEQLRDYSRYGVCYLIVPMRSLTDALQMINREHLWERVALLWFDAEAGTARPYKPLLFTQNRPSGYLALAVAMANGSYDKLMDVISAVSAVKKQSSAVLSEG